MRLWAGNETAWIRANNLNDDPWHDCPEATLGVKEVGQYCVPYILWASTRERQRCHGPVLPNLSQMWKRKTHMDDIYMSQASENELEPPEAKAMIETWKLMRASSGRRFAANPMPELGITPLWLGNKATDKAGYWFDENRLYFRLPSIHPEPAWVNIYVAPPAGERVEVYADETEEDDVYFIAPKVAAKRELVVFDKTTVKWIGFAPIEGGKNLVLVVIIDQTPAP